VPTVTRKRPVGAATTDSRIYPGLERVPGKQNWVDKAGGLPDYIERIAKHLHYEVGYPIDRAIATAVNTVKRWAAGGSVVEGGKNKVTAKTRALAVKALAEWESKKAMSFSIGDDGRLVFDLDTFLAPIELSMGTPDAAHRKAAFTKGDALPAKSGGTGNSRFPVDNRELAQRAIGMVQLAKGDKKAIRKWLMSKLRSKGWGDLIPANWNADGSTGVAVAVRFRGATIELARYVVTQEGARFYGVPIGALITSKGAASRVKLAENPTVQSVQLPNTASLSHGEKLALAEAKASVAREKEKFEGPEQTGETQRYRARVEKAIKTGNFSSVLFELQTLLASRNLPEDTKAYYRRLLNEAQQTNKRSSTSSLQAKLSERR